MKRPFLVPVLAGLSLCAIAPVAFATSGCCSHHGGIDHCDSSSGNYACLDGTLSPSCTCSAMDSAPQTTSPQSISSVLQSESGPTTASCQISGSYPDPACTPGAVFPYVTASQVCTAGYARSVRSVPDSEKTRVYAEYGILTHATGQYEVDHLIPLELGGSNDLSNLWPEPASPTPGFHEKDTVENRLHDEVCSGTMSLADAESGIQTDWLAYLDQPSAAAASSASQVSEGGTSCAGGIDALLQPAGAQVSIDAVNEQFYGFLQDALAPRIAAAKQTQSSVDSLASSASSLGQALEDQHAQDEAAYQSGLMDDATYVDRSTRVIQAMKDLATEVNAAKGDQADAGTNLQSFVDQEKKLGQSFENLKQKYHLGQATMDQVIAGVRTMEAELSGCTVTAGSTFADVPNSFYASTEINTLADRGIIDGYPDGTFHPIATVNRAELLKLLIAGLHGTEAKGESDCFSDVHAEWFSSYICAAKRLGWVSGYGNHSFRPAATVNRAEAIKMVVSSVTSDLSSNANLPTDVPVSAWFAPYVRKAVELGIIQESTFNPSGELTRADAAVWIYRGTTR